MVELNEFVKKSDVAIAFQLKEDNVHDVINWLIKYNFQYSYDEIKSAGQLIAYDRSGRPSIVGIDWWIVYWLENITVIDDNTFHTHFEPRSL